MKARTKFFQDIADGFGLRVSPRRIESAVRWTGSRVEEDQRETSDYTWRLSELFQRLGMRLTRVRGSSFDDIMPDNAQETLLLAIERGDSWDLVAITQGPHQDSRVEVLRGDRDQTVSISREQLEADWGITEENTIVFRISVLDSASSADPVSLSGRPVARLWRLLAPDRTEIWIVVGAAIGLGLLTLSTPIAAQAIINFVAFGGLMQPLKVIGVLLLIFLFFAGAIRTFKAYVVEILQRRLFVRVATDLYRRLPRVRVESYDRNHGPELVNRFFDVFTIQKAGSSLLIDGLDVVLQASIGLLVLGFYHPFLLVFDFVLIAVIAFILFGLGRGAVRTARAESNAKYEVVGALEELTRIPVTYKLSGSGSFAATRVSKLVSQYIGARRNHFSVVFKQLAGAVTLYAVASTGLLVLGGFLVVKGQLTLGQLVAAELIVSVALSSFVKFGNKLESFYDMLAGVDKLGKLLDLPMERDRGESTANANEGTALELRHVAYRYPGYSTGVRELSMKIKPGERVAVWGPRGAGKSTLADLLIGLRQPSEGLLTFDGLDLRDIAHSSMREQVELVKTVDILEGSLLENVRLGRVSVSVEDVREALQRLGILDEILRLPQGLQTPLTPEAAPLSKRTALLFLFARVLVKNPRLVVVDGTLDELDSESLAKVLNELLAPKAPWTLVVTTADQRVCDAMDRVVQLLPMVEVESPVEDKGEA